MASVFWSRIQLCLPVIIGFVSLHIFKLYERWQETNEKKSGAELEGGQIAQEALSGLDFQRVEGLVRLAPVQ